MDKTCSEDQGVRFLTNKYWSGERVIGRRYYTNSTDVLTVCNLINQSIRFLFCSKMVGKTQYRVEHGAFKIHFPYITIYLTQVKALQKI